MTAENPPVTAARTPTEALLDDGWYEKYRKQEAIAYWNDISAYTTDMGDTFVSKYRGWCVQFPSDVPVRLVVAAANALAGRPRKVARRSA